MNRDTLYSDGVIDLDAAPVMITLPGTAKRFMSMQVVSEDHYTTEVVYAPGGRHTYNKGNVGTRYVFIIIRTLANPEDGADVKAANALQDQIHRVANADRDPLGKRTASVTCVTHPGCARQRRC